MYFTSVVLTTVLILASCNGHPPPGPHRGPFLKVIEECKTKTGVNHDEMDNVMMRHIPKTRNEACMWACMNKKMEIMDDDNKLRIEKVKDMFSHMAKHNEYLYNMTMKMYLDCKTAETAETDECVAAQKLAECITPKEKEFMPPHPISPRILMKSHNECRNNTGISEYEYDNFKTRKVPQSKSEGCMLACMEKKFGFIGADNKINITKVNEKFSFLKYHNIERYNKTLKVYTDCKVAETAETDECDAAKKYAECVIPKEMTVHIRCPYCLHMFRPNIKPPLPQRVYQFVQECQNITGANKEEVYAALNMRGIKTRPAQCMLACFEKKNGLRGPDNKIVMENIKRLFAHTNERRKELYDKTIQDFQECADAETTESDECVAAFKFAQCLEPKLQKL